MSVEQDAPKITTLEHQPDSCERGARTSFWESAYEHPLSTAANVATDAWKAVTENPIPVAAGVATAALGIGATLATKGMAGKFSPFAARNILLVEDGPYGAAIEAQFNDQAGALSWLTGPKVTHVTGITSLSPLTAKTLDGTDTVLNASKFNLAFVDGNAMVKDIHPEAVASVLRDNNVTTIATSLGDEMNKSMVANGATLAIPKSVTLPGLMYGRLNLKDAVLNPERVKSEMTTLAEELAGKDNPMRREVSKLLTSYITT